MNISELSIRRPVLATVLTIIIIIFGIIGYNTLGVREYPSVDNFAAHGLQPIRLSSYTQ